MTITIQGVAMSRGAALSVEETGVDVLADVQAIRDGTHTEATLLAHCLDGVETDDVGREENWRDYVVAVALFAGRLTEATMTTDRDTREQVMDAIEHRAINDVTREIQRDGIVLTWDEADRIGDAGAQWLRDRLGLTAETAENGVVYRPETDSYGDER